MSTLRLLQTPAMLGALKIEGDRCRRKLFGGFSAALNRAVRAVAKPARVRTHPRMVGRALQRDVERELDTVSRRMWTPTRENLAACRARDESRCAHLRCCQSPKGCRHLPDQPPASCSYLCDARDRSDGWAADTTRRTPPQRAVAPGLASAGEGRHVSVEIVRTTHQSLLARVRHARASTRSWSCVDAVDMRASTPAISGSGQLSLSRSR